MTNIRPATTKDLVFIVQIYNENILNTTSIFRCAPVSLEERKLWLTEKQKNNLPVLIAEKEKILQGFIALAPFRQGDGYRYTAEHSVYVAKDYQKQGVAKILLKALIKESRQLGIHNIIAGIDASNTASHALHHSLGFQNCGTITQAGRKFEKWLDLTFYSLLLNKEN